MKTEEAKTFEEKSWEERLQNAFDCNQRLISERDRLKEELKASDALLDFSVKENNRLKEENERLKGRNEILENAFSLDDVNKMMLIDSLKQLNSELVEASNQLLESREQWTFFAEGYGNGSASISEVNHAALVMEEAEVKMRSIINKSKSQ